MSVKNELEGIINQRIHTIKYISDTKLERDIESFEQYSVEYNYQSRTAIHRTMNIYKNNELVCTINISRNRVKSINWRD